MESFNENFNFNKLFLETGDLIMSSLDNEQAYNPGFTSKIITFKKSSRKFLFYQGSESLIFLNDCHFPQISTQYQKSFCSSDNLLKIQINNKIENFSADTENSLKVCELVKIS